MTRFRVMGAFALGLTLAGCQSGCQSAGGLYAEPPGRIIAVDAAGLPLPGHFDRIADIGVELKNKSTVETTKDGRQVWAVHKDFRFRTLAGDLITMPAGMSTDLASIPAAARAILPSDGPYAQAAIAHDLCFRSKGSFLWKGHGGHTRPAPYTVTECNQLLEDAMKSLNITPWRVSLIVGAVRLANGAGWGT